MLGSYVILLPQISRENLAKATFVITFDSCCVTIVAKIMLLLLLAPCGKRFTLQIRQSVNIDRNSLEKKGGSLYFVFTNKCCCLRAAITDAMFATSSIQKISLLHNFHCDILCVILRLCCPPQDGMQVK